MKVHELIKELKNCNPNATVIRTSSNFELNGASIEAKGVYKSNTGEKCIKNCVDAFDYTPYTVEEWSTIGGDKLVIEII